MPAEIAERVRARCPDTVVARGEVTAIVERDDLLETLPGCVTTRSALGFCSVTATDCRLRPRFWSCTMLDGPPGCG
jgi:hypothetical protein